MEGYKVNYTAEELEMLIKNINRRQRLDITNNLENLSKAIAEQNLEKYGYTIGDYFIGQSGYVYHLADLDTYYGGYDEYSIVSTHHCGVVVDTKSSSAWGSNTAYSASTLHSFLKGTAWNNIKKDLTALFGDWAAHLVSHTELDNAIGGLGTTWTGLANTYICALSEMQVLGSRVFGADGYQTGTANKQLELFAKFRHNEIIGNNWWWLRSLCSSSGACGIIGNGRVSSYAFSSVGLVVGLILLY